MVLGIVKELLAKKIYPNFKDYKETTEVYVRKTDREFYNSFASRRWNLYYERKLRKKVSIKLNSIICKSFNFNV